MKVTGYKIREAIARNKLRRETAAAQFTDSLHVFPGEKKRTPYELADAIALAEDRIAKLQVVQAQYNLTNVPHDRSLAFLVKLAGGLERAEKRWRSAAIQKKDRWASFTRENPLLRDEKQVAASATVSAEEAAQLAERIQTHIAQVREQIGVANGTAIEIENLDTSLFE